MEGSRKQTSISKVTFDCIKFLFILALPSLLAAEKNCTQGLTYLDPVTGNCDYCSDICDYSREQGTRARCDKFCKGYSVPAPLLTPCPAGQYYDKHVDRCDHCDTICLPPKQDDCNTLCPDWTSQNEHLPSTETINVTVSPTEYAAQGMDNQDEERGTNQALVGGVVAVMCVLAIVVVGMIAFRLRKPLLRKLKEIPIQRRCNKLPTQEQGIRMLEPETPIVRSSGQGPITQTTMSYSLV